MKTDCPRCGSVALPGGFANSNAGRICYYVCQSGECFHQFRVNMATGERLKSSIQEVIKPRTPVRKDGDG